MVYILNTLRAIGLLLVIFTFCASATAQDLISNTQKNIPYKTSEKVNSIGERVQFFKQKNNFKKERSILSLSTTKSKSFQSYVSEAVLLNFDSKALHYSIEHPSEYMELVVPVNPKNNFVLDLYQVNLFSNGVNVKTSDGQTITSLDAVFYRGQIKGHPNSMVSASFSKDEVRLIISDDNGTYIMGKYGTNNELILYHDRKLLVAGGHICETPDTPFPFRNNDNLNIKETKSAGDCIDIYIEADYDMYLNNASNTTSVTNFATDLFNDVATIYDIENISIYLSEIFVWTSPDPYRNINFSGFGGLQILSEFSNNKKNNFNGDLAHLIMGRNTLSGIAWVNILCTNYFNYPASNGCPFPTCHVAPCAISSGYMTSIPNFPTYSWDVDAFTHEMGHNLGSEHTHKCVWNGNNTQIDDCGNKYYFDRGWTLENNTGCFNSNNPILPPQGQGTIMSYCQLEQGSKNFNLGFGPQPGDVIRNKLNSVSCTDACPEGCTDPDAENYDPNVTIIDGSCTYCSNGIQDGDETGVDCGGSGPGCQPCLPDLVMSSCGSVTQNGLSISISGVTISNIGNATAGSSRVDYRLSTNTTYSAGDYLLGSDFVSAIAPGNSGTETQTYNLAPYTSIPSGSYYIVMKADYQSSVSESNEGNNTCFISAPKVFKYSCTDGIKNGDETEIDCGGSLCASCPTYCDDAVKNISTVAANTTYDEADVINVTATINRANIIMRAGEEVNMIFPFQVMPGRAFTADIQPCPQ